MNILIKDAKVHPVTGYMELDVVAVNEQGVHGPVKTYGTDTHQLKEKFNGDIDLWLASVKGTHELHAGHHDELVEKFMWLKGKTL